MDLEYRKMCLSNEILQDAFSGRVGDPVFTTDNKSGIVTGVYEDNNLEVTFVDLNAGCCSLTPPSVNYQKQMIPKNELSWLPYQHQIQDLLFEPLDSLLDEFISFVKVAGKAGKKYDLLEKWWLVYYMDKIHSLNWQNGKWE